MKIGIDELIEKLAVIWVVLTSGSMVFNICNMKLSMFILLGISIILIIRKKRISRKNIITLIALCAFTTLSILYNDINTLVINDLIILLIRLFSLTIIMSNVSSKVFRKTYVDFIFLVAAISLPCFFVKLFFPNFTLPFTISDLENNFYGTFYYTLGTVSKGTFNRNCGIFWESGLFQIYLNYALILLLCSKDIIIKNKLLKFIVLSLSVITTLSTMGYICFAIVVAIAFFKKDENMRKSRKRIVVFAAIALVALLIVESFTHIVEYKILNRGMSYASRYDDTIISTQIAIENPIFGTGPVNDSVSVFHSYMYQMSNYRISKGELSRSNGLANFAAKCGLIVTLIYLIGIYVKNKKMLETNILTSILVEIVLICCFCNEPIMFTTLWLSFFFGWKKSEDQEQNKLYINNVDNRDNNIVVRDF